MTHVEKTTGRSYPIQIMEDEHLIKVVDYYIDRLNKVILPQNVRAVPEVEYNMERLCPYLLVAFTRGLLTTVHAFELSSILERHRKLKQTITEQIVESELL